MANGPWMSKWQRSPRQDRRVVENGRFVEQGKVHLPEPPAEEVPEREQSALEIVTETPKIPEREQETTNGSTTTVVDDGSGSEGGVQAVDGGPEDGGGPDGRAPEAEGTPATEADGTAGRVPASDSVAPASGQTVNAVQEHIDNSVTYADIAGSVYDENETRNYEKIIDVAPVTDEDIDKCMHILPMPPIPPKGWELIEAAQREAEIITGRVPTNDLDGEETVATNDQNGLPETDIPF